MIPSFSNAPKLTSREDNRKEYQIDLTRGDNLSFILDAKDGSNNPMVWHNQYKELLYVAKAKIKIHPLIEENLVYTDTKDMTNQIILTQGKIVINIKTSYFPEIVPKKLYMDLEITTLNGDIVTILSFLINTISDTTR